jgi:hypothetical protein
LYGKVLFRDRHLGKGQKTDGLQHDTLEKDKKPAWHLRKGQETDGRQKS